MSINDYLYEIIDDYKNADNEQQKSEIFKNFCSSIWKSKNKRRTYKKAIRFKVRNDLLDTNIGQIFNAWSDVEYVGYKEMSNDTDWCSLIRQKINNLYTRYFDENVILNKDYMSLLKTPYTLYYRWIKGVGINEDELINDIETAIHNASELKVVYQKQKMKMPWSEYRKVIEGFLQKIFDNCKPIEEYEVENLTNKYIYELATEDNSYIRYFCKSLEGYMLNYQKQYYGLPTSSTTKQYKQYKRCKECGALIEKTNNRVMYCKECAKKMDRNKAKTRMQNIRKKCSI